MLCYTRGRFAMRECAATQPPSETGIQGRHLAHPLKENVRRNGILVSNDSPEKQFTQRTIVILSRGMCGLSNYFSAYMMTIGVAGFTVIVINIILFEILMYRLSNKFLYSTSFLTAVIYLLDITLEFSQWSTVAFTLDQYVAMCCPKLPPKYCRVKTLSILAPIILILLCVENIPMLFLIEPLQIIRSIYLGVRPKLDVLTSPIFGTFIKLKTIQWLFIAFGLICLFNGLTVRRILLVNKARRAFRSQRRRDGRDMEMESRRKSIILLISASGSFTLLWLPMSFSYFITSYNGYVNFDH